MNKQSLRCCLLMFLIALSISSRVLSQDFTYGNNRIEDIKWKNRGMGDMVSFAVLQGSKTSYRWDFFHVRYKYMYYGLLTSFKVGNNETDKSATYIMPLGLYYPIKNFNRTSSAGLSSNFYLFRAKNEQNRPPMAEFSLSFAFPFSQIAIGYRHQFKNWISSSGEKIGNLQGLFIHAKVGLRFVANEGVKFKRPMNRNELIKMRHDWERTLVQHDTAAYYIFLEKYPSSEFRDAAKGIHPVNPTYRAV